MSTKDYLEKDYYKALGVAKTAKPAEIKASYRKLARKYHPDANKGDASAEERFKEISEAYSVLSDEKRRKEYDEARSLFGGGFRAPTGAAAGTGRLRLRPGRHLQRRRGRGRPPRRPVRRRVRRWQHPHHRAEPAAPRRRRRDRDHAELQRRDRRDHRRAAADRRGTCARPAMAPAPRQARCRGCARPAREPARRAGTRARSGSPSRAMSAMAAAWWWTTPAPTAWAAAGR